MSYLQRVAAALALAGAFAPGVGAQGPPAPAGQPSTNPVAGPRRVAPTAVPAQRRSVVHHNPYPYPNYYNNDETAGFRNPGGGGRFGEYYPAGNQFQANVERDPIQAATFARGGGSPTYAQQMQAVSVGVSRYNSIQSHIDNYARPYMGYGFGAGGFGGFY